MGPPVEYEETAYCTISHLKEHFGKHDFRIVSHLVNSQVHAYDAKIKNAIFGIFIYC